MVRAFRIGIIGCGPAGLACAVALARAGHGVTIFERAPILGPVGAGLLLQPSGQAVLASLGLLDRVVAQAARITALHALTHRGRTLVRLPYDRIPGGYCGYGVHRGDLFHVLYDAATAAGAAVVVNTTIVGARQSETEAFAIDADGHERGPFDTIIGADGARSQFRKGPEFGAVVRQFPMQAAWFSGRCDATPGVLQQATRGTRQLVGLLPLGNGRASLFFALGREGKSVLAGDGMAAVKREVAALCPGATPLLEQINSADDLACGAYQLVHLRRWSAGRLICIGDAAHSTTPHLGQGVNLALLDAVAVAGALSSGMPVPEALAKAAEFRRRQVMWSWHISNLLGPVFQSDGVWLGRARDVVLPWLPALPWVGQLMVATMAGLATGPFRRLRHYPVSHSCVSAPLDVA